MSSPASTPVIHPPKQERSRRTLERILKATERLLLDHPFEEIGVQQIVRGARTSVGAFYARVEDKNALLTGLYERYSESLDEHVEAWQAAQGPPAADLFGASTWVARYLIDTFRERRNLLRALALHVRANPDSFDASVPSKRAAQHRFLEEALLTHRASVADPNPERAVRAAIFLAASACRERILFHDSPHARAVKQSDEELSSDLARMIVGYLLCPVNGTGSS